jgi:hypothetical protein
VTAYKLTPVDAFGVDESRAQVIDIPSRAELLLQNERLKQYLDAARLDVETYRAMWAVASSERIKAESRSTRAFRVLTSIERLSPLAAVLIERARVEVYGELP